MYAPVGAGAFESLEGGEPKARSYDYKKTVRSAKSRDAVSELEQRHAAEMKVH
jgi:hypothetical protein